MLCGKPGAAADGSGGGLLVRRVRRFGVTGAYVN